MGKIRLFLAGFAVLAVAATLAGQPRSTPVGDAKRFLGTWRLLETTQGGQADPIRGLHPRGLIYYDTTGHMAVQISPEPGSVAERGRRPFAGSDPTAEEARAALRGYAAYFGTYTIDERAHTVTHHREGNINPGHLGDFVRRYEFLPGDRLALTPLENQNRVIWERIK